MDHLSWLVHQIRRRDKLETDQIDRVPGRRQGRRHHDKRATIRLSRCIRPTTSLRLLPRSSPRRLPSHLKRKTARSCHHVLHPIHPPRQERFRKSKPGNGSIRKNNHRKSHNPGHRRSANHGQEWSRKADRYGWRQDCWNGHSRRSNEDDEGKTRTGNVGPQPLLTGHELRNAPEEPIEAVRQLTDSLLADSGQRAEFFFSDFLRTGNILLVPFFHPFGEVAEESMQLDTLLGKGVLYPWWSLWVDFSLDDLSLVQLVQPLSEARGAYPLYPPLELVESCRLLEP